jgi:hypothetical protein
MAPPDDTWGMQEEPTECLRSCQIGVAVGL